ncbi:MAG: hypothetical protein KDD55_02490, partial [Bdellovibrionales bacterium]|nr:hypothetical protein [Bdellovibrionales bacterium]
QNRTFSRSGGIFWRVHKEKERDGMRSWFRCTCKRRTRSRKGMKRKSYYVGVFHLPLPFLAEAE